VPRAERDGGGETRVTVADYASEYGPGEMIGGAADDATKPEYRVYKVARWTGRPADSAHVVRTPAERAADPQLDLLAHDSWSEYMAGAAPHDAPWRFYRLPNTATPDPTDSVDVPGPDVMGDQMLWCVYNDADPSLHSSGAGGSTPLGVEVRQTTFAYDRPGPLGSTVFVRFEIHNRGMQTITGMRLAQWADPDIGAGFDDLVGSDVPRSLGFAYNATGTDPVYGYAAPAVGFDLLAEHYSATLGRNTGMDAFTRYFGGGDPANATESFNTLRGLQADGTPIEDPISGLPTTFMVSGDPVVPTGWLDTSPGDRRLGCASGPWTLAPGDSLVFWVAVVIGQADTHIGSVAALRCADDYVQSIYDAGFAEPFPAPPMCFLPPANCPRASSWWADQCVDGSAFTPAEWLAIARWADSTSAVFDFTNPPLGAARRAALSPRPASPTRARPESRSTRTRFSRTVCARRSAIRRRANVPRR